MKKKQITKLLAVAAMAASPAMANPPVPTDSWAVSSTVSPLAAAEASSARADAGHAMAAIISIGFAALSRARDAAPLVALGAHPMAAMARPRTTPSGAPACGNVATRAPRPRECAALAAPILASDPAPAPTTAAMPNAANPTAQGAR